MHYYQLLTIRSARMEGFLLYDFKNRFSEARRTLLGWYEDGSLHVEHDVLEDLQNAPSRTAPAVRRRQPRQTDLAHRRPRMNDDVSGTHRPVRTPPLRRRAMELLWPLEAASFVAGGLAPLLRRPGRGDGHPVLVLPGFTANEAGVRPFLCAGRYRGEGLFHSCLATRPQHRTHRTHHHRHPVAPQRIGRAPRAHGQHRRVEPRRHIRAAAGRETARPRQAGRRVGKSVSHGRG